MATQLWNIDPSHSGVHFTVRHMVISKVRGSFGDWQGELVFDPQDLAGSRVTARIKAASIDTREAKRDEHLRSADFFDAENHPELTFTSTRFEKAGEGALRIDGELSIRGVTHPVVLEAQYASLGKDPWGNERIGFSAEATVNRRDFGLTWNQALEAGRVLVGDKVEISLDVQAVKQAAESSAA